jgi:alpha-L-fucosidase
MPNHGQTLLHGGTAAGRKFLGTGDPNGTAWSPGMVDVPLRGANKLHNWFWAPNQDHAVQPTETLVKMYGQSVGRNCNFVIGAVIKPDGTLPEADAKRLAEFGAEIKRRYGQPVAEIKGDGEVLELQLSVPAQLNAVMIMEDIAQGERVREYIIDGRAPGGGWVQLGAGQSIGHKRIQSFARQELSAVRLRLTKSIAPPSISRLAVFNISA